MVYVGAENSCKCCWHRIMFFWVVCALFCLLIPAATFADETEQNENLQTVRVGYFPVEGFQEYDEQTGVYSGYSYEFLMAIAAYTDWQYEFVPCDTFTDGLEMLKNGEIDLLNDVTKRADREGLIEYSSLHSGEACSYLMMHEGDSRVAYDDWEGIGKIIIGLDKQSIHSQTLLSIFAEHDVTPNVLWFDSEPELIAAWNAGEVDAYAAISDTAVEGHAVMVFSPTLYYLAATKGNTELISEVNYAIQELRTNDPTLETTIFDKYYNRASKHYTVQTREEQTYIRENPTVRVLYIPDWYPISYKDANGEFDGPFKQVYKLLAERTGLKFEFVPLDDDKPFDGIVDTYNCYMLAEHPADYTGAATYEVKLTQSFVKAPLVEVSKGTLKQGDTIALVEGDCLSEVAQRIFGDDFEYTIEDSIQTCIDKVLNGTVDGTILMSYESEYYQSQRKYGNLIYTVVNDGSYGFCLAVSNEADPLLYSIIVKGLNSISSGEVNNIFNQMTQELQKRSFWDMVLDNPLPLAVFAAVFAIILVLALSGWFFNQKIREKNAELESAVQKAEKATQSKTMFLANMSHDMRTPMNAIIGLSNLAMDSNSVEELKEYMSKINLSGKQLLALINDTLDVSRIENGKLTMNREYIMSSQMLMEGVASSTVVAEQKGVRFRLEKKAFQDRLLYVDAGKITKLFTNLLSNAVKFTPPGGEVVFFIERLGEENNVANYRMGVRDTGIGMSKEFLEHIFEPFSQERTDRATNATGTGLGMTIVKEFADFLGAKLEIKSELGKGTEVTVWIGYQLAAQVPEELQKKTTPVSGGTHRILVAEDHPLNAEIIKKLLEKKDYDVERVENGKECVARFIQAESGYFGLILMDIRMPEMDGLEATRVIRKSEKTDAGTIPIIAMTANAFEQDVKDCIAAGMNAHLSKPVEPAKLYLTLESYLTPIS